MPIRQNRNQILNQEPCSTAEQDRQLVNACSQNPTLRGNVSPRLWPRNQTADDRRVAQSAISPAEKPLSHPSHILGHSRGKFRHHSTLESVAPLCAFQLSEAEL